MVVAIVIVEYKLLGAVIMKSRMSSLEIHVAGVS